MCFMLIGGKNAFKDGMMLGGHNDDLNGYEAASLEIYPHMSHSPGSYIQLPTGPRIPQPRETARCLLLKTFRGNLAGDTIAINEHNVCLMGGENLLVDRNDRAAVADPIVENGVAGGVRFVALTQSKTARECVEKIGHFYTEYGNRFPCAVGILDENESWYIESGGGSAWVATSAYFIGVAAVILSGVMLKKTRPFAGEPAPFVMELPAYHAPTAGNVLRATWERGWSFIKRAGTVILLSAILMWFLQGFGFTEAGFGMVEDSDHSLLAAIGSAIAVIFVPLGFGDWRSTVATFTGLIAKEEVVNTFGVLYHYAGEIDLMEDSSPIWTMVAGDFNGITAYSFMIFNLLCAPCFAAMGAIKREMNNPKWTAGAIAYMCGFAYVVSMIVYQVGGLVTGEVSFGILPAVALALLAMMIYLLVRRGYQGETELRHLTAVSAAKM